MPTLSRRKVVRRSGDDVKPHGTRRTSNGAAPQPDEMVTSKSVTQRPQRGGAATKAKHQTVATKRHRWPDGLFFRASLRPPALHDFLASHEEADGHKEAQRFMGCDANVRAPMGARGRFPPEPLKLCASLWPSAWRFPHATRGRASQLAGLPRGEN